jgi:hypothetical protein
LCKNIGLLCQWSARLELLNISIIFYFDFFLLLFFYCKSRPYNTLEWTYIGGSQHTQNTGAYNGQTTNMETTHRNGETKMHQETEPFETSGGNPMWGGSINPTKGT